MTPQALDELRRGWLIILVAAIGLGCGLGSLPIYTLGAITKPLSDAFGWSRADVQAIYTWMSVGMVVAAPALGLVVDRIGVRRVTLWSLVGQSLGFAALGLLAGPLWSFYLIAFLTAIVGVGTLPITWTRVIVDRFDAARGLALGLALAGTGLAATFLPSLTTWLLAQFGWRGAYVGLAGLPAFVALPLTYALLQDREAPSARQDSSSRAASAQAPIAPDDVRAALRSRPFWVLAAAFFVVGACIAGLITHNIPLLTDRGWSAMAAARAAGVVGLSVIAGRIITGVLVDRYWAPAVACATLMLPAVSCVLLIVPVGGVTGAVVAGVLLGVAAGAEFDLLAYFVSRYFGTRHYGVLYACQYAVFRVALGAGPLLFGFAFDRRGSYDAVLLVAAVLLPLGSLLLLTLGAYPPRTLVRAPGSTLEPD